MFTSERALRLLQSHQLSDQVEVKHELVVIAACHSCQSRERQIGGHAGASTCTTFWFRVYVHVRSTGLRYLKSGLNEILP